MALTELKKVKQFAEKETKAKNKFNKQLSKRQTSKKASREKKSKQTQSVLTSKKRPSTRRTQKKTPQTSEEVGEKVDITCMGCEMSWEEDQSLQTGSLWIQCDKCDGWIHRDCCSDSVTMAVDDDTPFICPECKFGHEIGPHWLHSCGCF